LSNYALTIGTIQKTKYAGEDNMNYVSSDEMSQNYQSNPTKVLSKDVFYNMGQLLLAKGMPLTSDLIGLFRKA
jgi:hypothetical protein